MVKKKAKNRPPVRESDQLPPARRRDYTTLMVLAMAAAIAAAGAAAYSNSFKGVFILDDRMTIVENPYIRTLWPITGPIRTPPIASPARPVVTLSLAVNYAISQYDVWSYHVGNLIIHILAALALLGVVRRTLLTDSLKATFEKHAHWLAFVCALFWVVHPLQTQAVTYVVQRAESLMGLFFLLTLYLVIRGSTALTTGGTSPRGGSSSGLAPFWYIAAIFACAMGMGTKEVMITAPIIVFVYDRVFLSKSFGEMFRKRWYLYVGLALSWGIVIKLQDYATHGASAGFEMEILTPWIYAKTQCKVILYYIRLAFWPNPLAVDYCGWQPALEPGDWIGWGIGLGALLGATAAAFFWRPAVAFLGVWFFVILGPTSSFMPIADFIFEQRMYLSLAAIIVGVVIGIYMLGRRLLEGRPTAGEMLAGAATLALATGLGMGTFRRNSDYHSTIDLWTQNINATEGNYRAMTARAVAYISEGRLEEALADANAALAIFDKFPYAYNARAVALQAKGDLSPPIRGGPDYYSQAIKDFDKAIEIEPRYTLAITNRAGVHTKIAGLSRAGRHRIENLQKAVADCTMALELTPTFLTAYLTRGSSYNSLGNEHARIGRKDDAVEYFDLAIADLTYAIQLEPTDPRAYANRGSVYTSMEKYDKALNDYNRALQLDPDRPNTFNQIGIVHAKRRNYPEAEEYFGKALRAGDLTAVSNLGQAYLEQGKIPEAISLYRQAVKARKDWRQVMITLAKLLAMAPDQADRDGDEAYELAERANWLIGYSDAEYLEILAAAYEEQRNWKLAVQTANDLVNRFKRRVPPEFLARMQKKLELYKAGKPYHVPQRNSRPPDERNR